MWLCSQVPCNKLNDQSTKRVVHAICHNQRIQQVSTQQAGRGLGSGRACSCTAAQLICGHAQCTHTAQLHPYADEGNGTTWQPPPPPQICPRIPARRRAALPPSMHPRSPPPSQQQQPQQRPSRS